MNIGLLASGKLGLICLRSIAARYAINFVMTDSGSEGIIDFCRENTLPLFTGNPRKNKAVSFLKDFTTDIILSVNYLFIVDKDVFQHPLKFSVNFHGSLLPKYRGRTPHVWAIINNESETGITAHLMTEECDEGDLLLQEKVQIPPDATGAAILDIFFNAYPVFIDKVIKLIENSDVKFVSQDHSKATYFGQRTAADGKIDWNWQKERLRNWIRAQAHPYPGAYTFYSNAKIIINKIEYSDHGYNYQDLNGKILANSNNGTIVKTPNGAVTIIEMTAPPGIEIKTGDFFYG